MGDGTTAKRKRIRAIALGVARVSGELQGLAGVILVGAGLGWWLGLGEGLSAAGMLVFVDYAAGAWRAER